MPTTVTLADLRALDACGEQADLFAATFPAGITVTPDNYRAVATAAAQAGLDAHWYAVRALTSEEQVAYSAAKAPALAAYHAAEAQAWAAYDAAVAQAWAAYDAARARARAAYDAAVAQAWTAYLAAVARALCAILAARSIPDADA